MTTSSRTSAAPADAALARLLHDRTRVPTAVIASLAGLDAGGLRRHAASDRWAPRPRSARRTASWHGAIDRRSTGLALERAIADRLAALRSDPDGDPERTARTLSHLARGLSLARTYLAELEQEAARDDDGPPPRSLAQLRDELVGHMRRLRVEARARRRARAPGADPA